VAGISHFYRDKDENFELDGKTNLALNFFWLGFIIYTLIFTISITGLIPYRFVVVFQMVQYLGMFTFIIAAITLIRYDFESSYLKIVFGLYLFWQITVIMRGFVFSVDYIKSSLLDTWFGILIYFTPVLLLFPRKIKAYKKVFNVIVILGIAFVFYDLVFIKELLYTHGNSRLSQALIEYFARNLALPCGFILLTYVYHTDKRNLFSLLVFGTAFLLSAIRARRSLMFMSMTMLFISYLVFYFSNRGKIIKIVFSIMLVLSLGVYGAYVYSMQKSGVFGLLSSRMHEDTRSGVVGYFYKDMKPVDWLIGKGINGMYYCPGIDEGNRITTFRAVIETGYLQIILKGGLVSMVFILLIGVPAIIKGIFYSKNLLSKAAGIWIFWFLFNLFNSVGDAFILTYLLVWISIGICYEPGILKMTDSEIKSELK
jgi:hypothetical protein